MNGVIARITLRQLLSRRRTLLLLLLGGVLVLVAGIFRLAGEEARALRFTAGLLNGLGAATLMPLVALLFGTGAVGAEIEDGTAVFLALSLITSRALVFGLAYVLIWEGLLAGLFAGTRTLSVRQITLAFADAFADVPKEVFDAPLAVRTAAIVAGAVLLIATLIAIRRLRAFEIAGETA